MLTTETKRRIDNARDILVGQLPLPSDQVELITIALIYKFMDDIDEQSRELGGKATFFTGALRDLSWRKLITNTLSAEERVTKFIHGIEGISDPKHTQIPDLFKSIFRNAFLKFRDAQVLKLFLDEINGFTYDHSEELGNAFEYILAAMGTQGENGQFRTPRHIIEFIVDVVDPQKEDTILDPACGTAGFLISAYKHILAANTTPKAAAADPYAADLLKGAQREKLTQHITGYDITPLMGRLSRVNMYLHHFPNPVIHEYDTLGNKTRWDEKADVILANPPFMTPKGGVRPHDRFAIAANRSEVLFVDYIAEHLNPAGRAGIIVPEGIIFQSQNAYKQLRRMLVDGYLWAVVSLPAGVFNPYSGVKTSILFLDRALAQRTADVLFVKIENDGFGLGAQRREVEGDELPDALKALLAWKKDGKLTGNIGHAVPRKRILESPDVSLSGDRYRAVAVRGNGKWPRVELGEVCKQDREIVEPNSEEAAKLPYFGLEDIEADTGRILKTPIAGNSEEGKSTSFRFDSRHVLYGKLRPYLNKVALPDFAGRCTTELIPLLPTKRLNRHFLGYILRQPDTVAHAMNGKTGSRMPRADMDALLSYEIPLPAVAEQERLVAEWEGYRRVIEAARQILASYKPTLPIDPKWPMMQLGEICNLVGGFAFKSSDLVGTKPAENYRPVVKIGNVNKDGRLDLSDVEYHEYTEALSKFCIKQDDILIAMTGATVGKAAVSAQDGLLLNQRVGLIRAKQELVLQSYISCLLMSSDFYAYCQATAGGGAQGNISPTQILSYEICVPPLAEQRSLVAELAAERGLVEANRELAARFEAKLAQSLAAVWGG